jgi:flagellar motility protein MotE (MotC chaperone)
MTTALEQHDDLAGLRRAHPAWRLLSADNAPLVLGFLDRVFLTPNVRVLPGPELYEALDDHLYALRAADPSAYPKSAEAYIAAWADPKTGWLRRSYPPGTDVAHYAPTSAVETAAAFTRSLGRREFLGTASRLLTVRDLLRQIMAGAATEPEVRLAALQRQRAEIDEQIEAIRVGADDGLDDTAVRERYAQAVATARELLADLREVEENFRSLDRDVRLRATTWNGPRGEFLKTVFGSTAEIGASDQGRSWKAFWEHMLSSRQQAELEELLAAVAAVPALSDAGDQIDQLLREELFVAADATQRTVASLSAQLRRFLDERSWTESRRIHEIIRATLAAALEVRDGGVRELGSELPGMRADITLPLERTLYTPRSSTRLNSITAAEEELADVEALADLFDISHIDLTALRASVAETVTAHGGHATLGQVVRTHPLTDGLAELVGYLQVSDDGASVLADRREQVDWVDATGRHRVANVPLVLFGTEPPPPTALAAAALPTFSTDLTDPREQES